MSMQEPGLDRHEWETEFASIEEGLHDDPRAALPELREEPVDFLRREGGEPPLGLREAVRAADPDLSERLYPGWRGVGYRQSVSG